MKEINVFFLISFPDSFAEWLLIVVGGLSECTLQSWWEHQQEPAQNPIIEFEFELAQCGQTI